MLVVVEGREMERRRDWLKKEEKKNQNIVIIHQAQSFSHQIHQQKPTKTHNHLKHNQKAELRIKPHLRISSTLAVAAAATGLCRLEVEGFRVLRRKVVESELAIGEKGIRLRWNSIFLYNSELEGATAAATADAT